MFTHFVQQGCVVAAIHHCDGSSTRSTTASGAVRMYEAPSFEKHGTSFRVHQIDVRERELEAMRAFVVDSGAFPARLRALVDTERVFCAGFSYGAATTSL
jgi:hypothetical protein